MLNALAQASYDFTTTTSPDSEASGGALAAMGIMLVVYVAVAILMMVSGYKVFEKAKRPGWGALVPYHNLVLALEMAGKPGWWILVPLYFSLLMLIPLLGLFIFLAACIVFVVYYFIITIAFVKAFGKGTGFGVFMAFFPWIALPILAFGKASYVGPQATAKPAAPVAA